MRGLNLVQLIGNLGADPELRTTANGKAFARFSVATNEVWSNAQGQKQTHAEWHHCIAWGQLAELVEELLAKGKPVYVQGKNRTSRWEDNEGRTHQRTDIVVRTFNLLDTRQPESVPDEEPLDEAPQTDDNVPF